MSRDLPARGLARLVCSVLLLAATIAGAEPPGRLDILVYGASGQVGSRIVNEGIRRGHHVTAVTRDASDAPPGSVNFATIEGDLLDPASVARAVAGRDIVILSVRGNAPGTTDPAHTIHRLGVQNVVEALQGLATDAPRFLIVGGAGTLEVRAGVTYTESIPALFKLFLPASLRRELAGHLLTLEYLAGVESVDWVYFSPPKKLYAGDRSGNYQLGIDVMLYDERGRSRISMEDFAVAIIDEAERAEHHRQHLAIASP